jgi:DNA-binding MarR family transcriptional regulator
MRAKRPVLPARDDAERLIAILAVEDAIWVPVRDFKLPQPTNAYFGRKDFALGVVPPFAGGSEGDRKTNERMLARLEDAGLVAVHRPKGRAATVRLTDAGEALARAVVGLPSLADAVELVRILADDPGHGPPEHWVPETAPACRAYGGTDTSEYVKVEEQLLPALRRGWVESNANRHGQIFYRVVAESRAAIQANPPAAPDVGHDEDHRRAYYAAIREALDRLKAAEPRWAGELGFLPLPVSMGYYLGPGVGKKPPAGEPGRRMGHPRPA